MWIVTRIFTWILLALAKIFAWTGPPLCSFRLSYSLSYHHHSCPCFVFPSSNICGLSDFLQYVCYSSLTSWYLEAKPASAWISVLPNFSSSKTLHSGKDHSALNRVRASGHYQDLEKDNSQVSKRFSIGWVESQVALSSTGMSFLPPGMF